MGKVSGFIIAALLGGSALLVYAQGTPPPTPLALVTPDGRRTVPTGMVGNQEVIALDEVATLFQVTVAEDAPTGAVTVSYRGRTIVLSPNQSIAAVNGRAVALPAPPTRSGRRVFVPLEFLSRALAPIYDRRIDLRRASRLLIVGDVTVPRVSGRVESAGPPTRLAIDVSPAAPVSITSDNNRVLVRIDAATLDLALPADGAGLVEDVRAGEQPNTVAVVLAGTAGAPRTNTTPIDGGVRITIEVPSAAAAANPAPPAPSPAPVPAPPSDVPSVSRRQFSVVVIDPGHGGDDAGVSAGSLTEKELTLDVSRRLRQRLEARLGVRVLLTRDDDRLVGLDERASLANNNKADLFLSLHANAAFGPAMSGAEVYVLGLDREGEDVRRGTSREAVSLPVLGGGRRTLEVVPWNLAQAAHIDASAVLSKMLDDELRRRVPMSPRPVQQAGMRILTGVNMPAALVEMAYLTNPGQAGTAGGDTFRNAVADALFDAIVRFRVYADAKAAP